MSGALLSVALFAGLAILTAEPRFDVDSGIRGLVELTRSPALDVPMQAVTLLGQGAGLVPLIVLTSLGLWRRHRHWALVVPLVMAGSGALQYAAKWAVDRPRPNLAPWGYPSGHVLSLVVFLGLLVYLLHSTAVRRRWRLVGTSLAAATLSTVAFSRLYLDVHWLSDLGGGFTLGLGYLLFSIWLAENTRHWPVRGAAGEMRPARAAPSLGAILPGDRESTAA